jgi:hypothetical protein
MNSRFAERQAIASIGNALGITVIKKLEPLAGGDREKALEETLELLMLLTQKRKNEEPIWGEQLIQIWDGLDFIREVLED